VRTRLRALLAAGFVQLGHKGKPRTYLRTQQSYRVVPSHGPFDPETTRRRPPKQAQR
jgi:predicted RNA binding protein YcfA (HicA-like mRNA interferase family)